MTKNNTKYVSRAGEKLEHAMNTFGISVKDLVCADFGSNTGGFPEGSIVALVKPHYESRPHMLRKGRLAEEFIPEVLENVRNEIRQLNLQIIGETESPVVGEKAKNKEYLLYLKPL